MTDDSSKLLPQFQDLDSFWKPMDAATSEVTYRELLPAARHLTGKDRCYLIELIVQIARAQTSQRKALEARANLDEAERLLNEDKPAQSVSVKIRWLIERARLYITEKTPSQARASCIEAWGLATQLGQDHFMVELAQLMAAIEPQKTQQEWIMKAIQIAEKSNEPKAKLKLGNLYTSLAWKLYDLRQFEKSLATFKKSITHHKNYGTEREIFVAKWSTGKVLRAMNKTEEALAVQKELLAEVGVAGAHSGRLYEELAECLQTLNRAGEAQTYFELAYKELSHDEWVTDNQPVKLKRMKDLGKVRTVR